jgi:hypothetical protein
MKKCTVLLIILILFFLTSCSNKNDIPEEPSEIALEQSSGIMPPSSTVEYIPEPPSEKIEYPLTSEEYAAIRALVPYEGLVFIERNEDWYDSFLDEQGEIGKKLYKYVNTLNLGNYEAQSPHNLDDEYIILTTIKATKPFATSPYYVDLFNLSYLPELEPIVNTISSDSYMLWLKEHVEQSAKLLFGEDFEVNHGEAYYYFYNETSGAYGAFTGNGAMYSFIFGYEDFGDSYRVEVAYFGEYGSFFDLSTFEDIAHYNDDNISNTLREYMQNRATRYHLYMLKQNDSLVFQKQVLAPK